MRETTCNWPSGNGYPCPWPAEWTYSRGESVSRVCESHLPELEREFPDATILPLDTENH